MTFTLHLFVDACFRLATQSFTLFIYLAEFIAYTLDLLTFDIQSSSAASQSQKRPKALPTAGRCRCVTRGSGVPPRAQRLIGYPCLSPSHAVNLMRCLCYLSDGQLPVQFRRCSIPSCFPEVYSPFLLL